MYVDSPNSKVREGKKVYLIIFKNQKTKACEDLCPK